MYGGEDAPLSSRNGSHYMNRRVEFRICEPTDTDMARPEGGSAGRRTGSSGSSFKGNKNSGY
jgi:hypothetical protein